MSRVVEALDPFGGVSGLVATAAETPEGNPETAMLTGPLKLIKEVTVMVVVPVEPWFMLSVFDERPTVKSPVSSMPKRSAPALLQVRTTTSKRTKRTVNRFDFRFKPIRCPNHLWAIYFSVISGEAFWSR